MLDHRPARDQDQPPCRQGCEPREEESHRAGDLGGANEAHEAHGEAETPEGLDHLLGTDELGCPYAEKGDRGHGAEDCDGPRTFAVSRHWMLPSDLFCLTPESGVCHGLALE